MLRRALTARLRTAAAGFVTSIAWHTCTPGQLERDDRDRARRIRHHAPEVARWLKAIMQELETKNRHRAFLALRVTLHALRDRLPPETAVEFGAQLPVLLRGFYYEGWKLSTTPHRERTLSAFLAPVGEAFPEEGDFFPERAARAVFKVVAQHVTAGEADKVRHLLPAPLRALWPEN
jgi:uncharacterized protein (DUF2267 family)